MEGGLTTGYENPIPDSEIIGMMGALRAGIDFPDAEGAMQAIDAVGAGRRFPGCEHAQARRDSAFHPPVPSRWRPHERQEASCKANTAEPTTAKGRETPAARSAPTPGPGVAEAMDLHVARCTREIGDDGI